MNSTPDKMKCIKFIAAIFMAFVFVTPAWSDTKDSSKSSKPREIPILIRKTKESPMNYAPSRGIEVSMTMYESGTVGFILPFESYPVEVSVFGEGAAIGCWTSILTDASDVMPFDGGEGDYRLEISTSDGVYVGGFTLE